jgi:hypothetical protein
MKIGAAGKNGQMPQSRPMLSTAAANPRNIPTRIALPGNAGRLSRARPPALLALSHLCRLADR